MLSGHMATVDTIYFFPYISTRPAANIYLVRMLKEDALKYLVWSEYASMQRPRKFNSILQAGVTSMEVRSWLTS